MKVIAALLTLFISLPTLANTVLYLGDSHSRLQLGRKMFHFLSQSYENVQVFGVSSSSPRHWIANQSERNGRWLCEREGRHNLEVASIRSRVCQAKTDERIFNKLLKRYSPDLVVLQFLGNSTGFSREYIVQRLSWMMEALPEETDCIFITSPPHHQSLPESNRNRLITESHFLEGIGERCHIIRGMTESMLENFASRRNLYAGDRRHLSSRGAQAFFEYVVGNWPFERIFR